MKNKLLLASILTFYILMPILILFNSYLYDIKFYLLTGIATIIYLLFRVFKVSNKELGITKHNLVKSIKRNIPFIVLCLVVVVILKLIHVAKYNPNESILFYIFYIFVSCPIQEFLYRGVFGYFNINSKCNYLWIIISSLCYSFVHIVYKDLLTLLLTFMIGIIWYILYKKDNNLCGVILSHMVLGIVTISLGIVN